MANSKKTSFNKTVSSTLSFITVLFEDVFEAVNIQVVLVGEKVDPFFQLESQFELIIPYIHTHSNTLFNVGI
jgi:hypothetical protein